MKKQSEGPRRKSEKAAFRKKRSDDQFFEIRREQKVLDPDEYLNSRNPCL